MYQGVVLLLLLCGDAKQWESIFPIIPYTGYFRGGIFHKFGIFQHFKVGKFTNHQEHIVINVFNKHFEGKIFMNGDWFNEIHEKFSPSKELLYGNKIRNKKYCIILLATTFSSLQLVFPIYCLNFTTLLFVNVCMCVGCVWVVCVKYYKFPAVVMNSYDNITRKSV